MDLGQCSFLSVSYLYAFAGLIWSLFLVHHFPKCLHLSVETLPLSVCLQAPPQLPLSSCTATITQAESKCRFPGWWVDPPHNQTGAELILPSACPDWTSSGQKSTKYTNWLQQPCRLYLQNPVWCAGVSVRKKPDRLGGGDALKRMYQLQFIYTFLLSDALRLNSYKKLDYISSCRLVWIISPITCILMKPWCLHSSATFMKLPEILTQKLLGCSCDRNLLRRLKSAFHTICPPQKVCDKFTTADFMWADKWELKV